MKIILSILSFTFLSLLRAEDDHHKMQEDAKEMGTTTTLRLSKEAQKMAEVETSPVERKFVPYEIRLYGKVDYDETKVENITAWVAGRIEKLYVNFTGMEVAEGERMLDYYSPELIIAEEELLQYAKLMKKVENSSSFVFEQAKRTLESTREKLRLLGLDQNFIDALEKSGKIMEIIPVNAPQRGVVIKKNALEGEYVKEGTIMFMIADLDAVWVNFDAYESDLFGLIPDQEVLFQTDAYPGINFKGRISFIDPFLNEMTRTAKVRVIAENKDGRLKPGLYATALVQAYISQEGKIFPTKPAAALPPMVIPGSAPLITGKRAIAYVQNPADKSEYRLREIVLGPKVGDYYIVYSGLREGEMVVTRGNFQIDSQAQIQAMPSMMQPEGGIKPMKGHGH